MSRTFDWFGVYKGASEWNEWRRREPETRPNLYKLVSPGTDLRGFDFSNTDLSKAELQGADLSGADLTGAKVRKTNLRRARLDRVVGNRAYLGWADLREATLCEADLRDANLEEANLRGADLTGANLIGAILDGADLRETTLKSALVYEEQLRTAVLGRTNVSVAARVVNTVIKGETSSYYVNRHVGQGGIATVYEVKCVEQAGRFAAKVLSPHRFPLTQTAVLRFRRELDIQRSIRNPHVLRIHEVIAQVNSVIAILELAERGSLYDRLRAMRRDKRLVDVETACVWMAQMLCGLHALHERGIIHRDLSPKNILFLSEDRLAIADLGIARRLEDPTLTQTSDKLGSLIYISARQREDPHASNTSDDVFSLGQIFYEILTSLQPHGNPPPIQDVRPDVPKALVELGSV